MDELWRDFNRRLSGLFGVEGRRPRPTGPAAAAATLQPDMRRGGRASA